MQLPLPHHARARVLACIVHTTSISMVVNGQCRRLVATATGYVQFQLQITVTIQPQSPIHKNKNKNKNPGVLAACNALALNYCTRSVRLF
jgi:hypothetical protein